MTAFPGFIGGSNPSQSLSVDTERTVNLYPEIVDGGTPRSQSVLYGTPGRALLATCEGPHRGSFAQDGRAFLVAGSGFYEVDAIGTFTRYGDVQSDGHPVQIGSNGIQLAFISGGLGYLFTLATNTLVQITSAGFPSGPLQINDRDDTFFVLSGGRIQASALGDGSTWDASQFGANSQSSDPWVSMLWAREQLWIWGSRTGQVWYDAGNAGFPLAAIIGGFIEMGIAAPYSACLHNQTPTWLGQDRRGGRIVVHANGFAVQKISTMALDYALSTYSRVDDAVAWSEMHAGHEFYVLTSPSWPTTWVYDGATQLWHERVYLNPTTGQEEAARPFTHMYAFNEHLVGDRSNGNLYMQALGLYTDAGDPLVSIRRAPVVANADRMLFHDRFALITQPGVADSTGQGAAPLVSLKWSDDGGRTFGNSVTSPLGPIGAYRQVVEWRRLGGTRFGRVYEVAISDPIRRVLINAELDITKGTN